MKKIITTAESIGKTIGSVFVSFEYAAIHFTDDTCLVFQAHESYDDSVAISVVDGSGIYAFECVNLGICSLEEEDELSARKEVEMAALEEERSRKLYQQLKERFEP